MSDHKMGSCIATLRKEKGWTQKQLAEKLQLSDKAISKWESNKGAPSIEFLPEIAKLFDVTTDYLLKGEEEALDVLKNYKAKDVSEKEKEAVINNNMVDIKKLIQLDNFDVYQELINKYPATKEEELENKLSDKKYDKEIYNYIIKNCDDYYKRSIGQTDYLKEKWDNILLTFIKGDKEKVFEMMKSFYGSKNFAKKSISEDYLNYDILKSRGYSLISKDLVIGKKSLKFKEVINNKDLRFFDEALKHDENSLDWALENVEPNNFTAIKFLLDNGAKLHKRYTIDDDGWGYPEYVDEIDEIGTEILRKRINETLGVK